MLEFLKKHSMVGLALAIASAFVLAHIGNKTVDYLCEEQPGVLVGFSMLAAVLLFGWWLVRRQAVRGWLDRRKRALILGSVMVALIATAGVGLRIWYVYQHREDDAGRINYLQKQREKKSALDEVIQQIKREEDLKRSSQR